MSAKAQLSYVMYAHKIKKHIGSFSAVIKSLDELIFTSGVVKNDILVHRLICADLYFLCIALDEEKIP
ncbi:MAG: hypothetical protein ABI045_02260 [Flavobacteriales bacterium]